MMQTTEIPSYLPLSLQQGSSVQKTAAEPNAAQAAKTGQAPNQGDQTTLNPGSALLAQAMQTSDVRMDKVTSLQQTIAAGSYHVSSADVAQKMIDSLLE